MTRLLAALAAFIFVLGVALHQPSTSPHLSSPVVYAGMVDKDGDALGHGTAFYIGNDQFITAGHVAKEATDGNQIILRTDTGTEIPTSVVWVDPDKDVALLQSVSSTNGEIAKADLACDLPDAAVGERVTSIGYPMSLGRVQTWGRVASDRHIVEDKTVAILADITIAPGNSGGPVFDSAGRVAGMSQAIAVGRLGQFPTEFPFAFIVPRSVICADVENPPKGN